MDAVYTHVQTISLDGHAYCRMSILWNMFTLNSKRVHVYRAHACVYIPVLVTGDWTDRQKRFDRLTQNSTHCHARTQTVVYYLTVVLWGPRSPAVTADGKLGNIAPRGVLYQRQTEEF
jgi:hypothetical protein